MNDCWGCGTAYLKDWSIFELSAITSFVTGNEKVMVCPDCREEIESIEKESNDDNYQQTSSLV